jgi:hypothetical protein
MKPLTLALLAGPSAFAALLGSAVTLCADWFAPSEVTQSYSTPEVELGRHRVEILENRQVAPSLGMASDVVVQSSNNNLDAVRYHGRLYLTFRTAPHSYADPSASVYVVSSDDEYTFRKETEVFLASDLREPRLMVMNDQLFLYVSRLGTERYEVEPQGVYATKLEPNGDWGRLRALDLPGHIVWRTRMAEGVPLMTAYVGGRSVYQLATQPLEVRLLTTEDGFAWRPLLSVNSHIYRGGGSEAAFTGDDDGNLYSVVRNDAADHDGKGTSVCFAAAENWTNWDCINDPRRFDSPNLFTYDGEIYLTAARQPGEQQAVLPDFGNKLLRSLRDEFARLTGGQRCALFRYVKTERRLAFVLDLPSRGETCSTAVVPTTTEGQFAIYNVSSSLDGPELSVGASKDAPSKIYRHLVQFDRQRLTRTVAY